jgi:amino-acid N-acetyltransferase
MPIEEECILAARGQDVIERDIQRFSVIEHDRVLFGCAALFPFPNGVGELACLAVDPDVQGSGDGERLLKRVEMRAKKPRAPWANNESGIYSQAARGVKKTP